LGLVAVVATLGVGVSTGVFALHKDWADNAWNAAVVLLAVAGIILVVGILILAWRRFQWLTLGLLALLLVALSGAGAHALTNQPAIHQVQARVLENNRQWQASIREKGPADERRYGLQRYREATNRYLQALADDDSDATTETRARKRSVSELCSLAVRESSRRRIR
jgi:hypothetical protein